MITPLQAYANRINRQSSKSENLVVAREVDFLEDLINEVGLPVGVQKDILYMHDSFTLRVKLRDVYGRTKSRYFSLRVLTGREFQEGLRDLVELFIVSPWE